MNGGPRRAVVFGRLGHDLLSDPLAFLSAEHARQSVLLGHLERIARRPDQPGARVLAAALAEWLSDDLPRHLADEERSLHTRLVAHDTRGVLRRLGSDHEQEREQAQALLSGLSAIAAHLPVPPGFAELALGFVADFRDHLALEEAELQPLARRVLPAETLNDIAAEMAARRSSRRCP